ncbi:TOX high mobility group box family member 4b [Etheostoma cragini]|uniref:TOX high mobility group box family member 4b n=1 Tax=Etheostoma cragini TaxID=417921 RepID=UPI00155E6F37|nr:TOX high mobility group box family member 4b [Etheostoma cragini]
MDLHFYSDLTDGTGPHDGDPEFLDPQSFNGFDTDNKFPGGSDNYLTISGSGHPFLSSSECSTKPIELFNLAGSAGGTFHTPSLGDEEFEIPPISLDPDSALTVSDVVSHFGELSDTGPSNSVVVPGNAVVEGDDPSFASTFVNAPSQGLEHLSLGVINQSGGSALLGSSLGMDLGHPIGSQFSSSSPVTIDVPLGDMSQGLLGSNQLTTIDQSELSAQLGLGLGGGNILQHPQSPDNPLSATASPTSSLQDDDMDDFRRSVLVESPVSLAVISLDPSLSESPLSASTSTISPAVGRKGGAGGKKGKKKKDPNEPQKPVSAYALFFRDTQAAIKGQNPNATFGEVSKIVASMWDSLGEEQKQIYKRKNEASKKDYLKALAEYRAGQIIEQMSTVCTAQMQSTPFLPRLQQMVHAQAPPPLQAKPRAAVAAATAPPPLQIKFIPSPRQSDSSVPIIVTSAGETPTSVSSSGLTVRVGQSADVVTGGEEVAEAEEGMEVEVSVAPVPSVTPAASRNICVRAGCTKPAVESKDWDKEYCSNECVATHCRDVFMAWCAIRGQNSTTVT